LNRRNCFGFDVRSPFALNHAARTLDTVMVDIRLADDTTVGILDWDRF